MTVCAFSETFICALKNLKPNINTILCIIRKTTSKREMTEHSKFKNPLGFSNHLYEIDSKHVVMQVPACSCSSYFNYKKTLSNSYMLEKQIEKKIAVFVAKALWGTKSVRTLFSFPQPNNGPLI